MLGFIFKALNDNDLNIITKAQQRHNNFHFVVPRPQQIRLLLCPCWNRKTLTI